MLSCTFPFRPLSLPTHHFSTNLLMACPSQTVALSLISRLSLFVHQLPQHVPHSFLDIISIYHAMVSSLWWTFHMYEALFTLAPSSVSSPLLPLLFFPSALCLSPCLQHILTRYRLVFRCSVKRKKYRQYFLKFTAIQLPHALNGALKM